MLLLYPPIALPSEPPLGIATIAGALRDTHHRCTPVDLNIEALLHLIDNPTPHTDTWTRRALANRDRNIEAIRSASLYRTFARYQKCVFELNRLLETSTRSHTGITMANYQDHGLNPLRSDDLLHMAAHPERCLFFPFFTRRLSDLLAAHSPDCIGISINYLSQALCGFALIGCIRKMDSRIKIICGGGLITSWMRGSSWNEPFAGLVDHCIPGCGIDPLLRLLGGEAENAQTPAFGDFYLQNYLSPVTVLPYSTSSGCYWSRCSFCPERAEKSLFRGKRFADVAKELQALTAETKPGLIHFADSAIPPRTLAGLADLTLGVPWYGFVRATSHLLDLDFCRQLRKSGCVMLKLGIESGDQQVLDRLEKGIDLTCVSQALKNLHAAGIATYVYLLFGTPPEGRAEAETTLQFTAAHSREIDFLNLAIFNMPVDSHECDRLKTAGFDDSDLPLYTDFAHPRGWSRKMVRVFLDREFRKKPEIGMILRRDPPFFTSNHAPFFTPGFPP